MDFLSADWISALLAIVLIDLVLAGDNAVIIALACRQLPPAQRRLGILYGTAGAIGIRVVLIFFAMALLAVPFLKIVGALLLLWIGVKLLQPQDDDAHGHIQGSDRLWPAVKTVIVADLVMSLDNVIAIAGAAEAGGGEHRMPLVVFGLLLSVPIVVWGSQLVLRLMDRFPWIITAGGMLLGWIAGTMGLTDPVLLPYLPTRPPAAPDALPEVIDALRYGAGLAGALLVLLVGRQLARRARLASAEAG